MIPPETLLRMPPLEAVRAQIEENLKAPLKASHLKIGKPVSIGGLKTEVLATIDKSTAPVELWDRVGGYIFRYDRLDLTAFTEGLSKNIPSQLPVDATSLLGAILGPFGIPIVADDLVPAVYTSLGNNDLLANEFSYRWVGTMVATINAQALEIAALVKNRTFTFMYNKQYNSAGIKSNIVMQINLANPGLAKPILGSMFSMSAPVQSGPDHDGDNTTITLTFSGQPYVGAFDIKYQRRSFPKTFRWPVKLTGAVPTDTSKWATALSAQMGCTITANDIRPEPVPTTAVGAKQKVAVNFDSTSLAYVGSILVEYTRTI